ncbi:MAG: hypothetical protein U0807_17995 [Candidatus Binatia bacterium]
MLRRVWVLALWAVLAPGAAETPAQVPGAPRRRTEKLRLRVGEQAEFSATPVGDGVTYRWVLDGRGVATARSWRFAPDAAQVGTHAVTVRVGTPAGPQQRTWSVRVRPPAAPRLIAQVPDVPALKVGIDEPVELRVQADASDPAARVHVAWSVDGVAAGEGDVLRLHPTRPGVVRVRALVTTAAGAAVAREWRVVVRVPSTSTSLPPTTSSTRLPPTTSSTLPRPTTSTTPSTWVPTTTSSFSPRPTTTTAPQGVTVQDARAFLEQYAAAWRRRDVDALRRLGQVTSDEQGRALREYFAGVRDFDVQVEVLDVHASGDRAVVRFIRRDTFRDPSGRLVSKETPPLEKQVARTPQGLRFVAADR